MPMWSSSIHDRTAEKNFSQDIDTIRKSLWENSDSMRNLIVAKAKTMIEKEYGNENLSLALVANQLNISYGYLSTIFTKAEGRSFKTYLVEVRMEKPGCCCCREITVSMRSQRWSVIRIPGILQMHLKIL